VPRDPPDHTPTIAPEAKAEEAFTLAGVAALCKRRIWWPQAKDLRHFGTACMMIVLMPTQRQKPHAILSDTQREDTLERYLNNEDVEKIALSYGVSPAAIYSIASRAGIHRQHNLTDEERERILQLHDDEGLSQREIGRRLGTSPTSVRRVLRQNNETQEVI